MSSSPWRDLGLRAASAAVLGPIGLAAIWFGGAVWVLTLAVISAIAGLELAGLCGLRARSRRGIAVPLLLAAAIDLADFNHAAAALAVLLAGGAALRIVRARRILPAGLLYIGIAGISLVLLRQGPHGFHQVLFLMLVVWSADIGAYLFGRALGGPKLAPSISPGKTRWGAVGGTFCGALCGLLLAPHPATVLLALLLAIVAQLGDLLESAVKRHVGAKDSGWIIPGHGGLLDRVDGVLAAAPAALLWASLFHPF